ncbi:exported hypothetical protein [Mesorhizobium sp. SOD10]|nr:exported hypothetical protein [Mesorhizobium sp. SOD10]
MRTFSAIAGSALFLVAAPGIVAGLAPWFLTDHYRKPLSALPGFVPAGSILVIAAAAILLHAFVRFALEGLGTPLPWRRPRNWLSVASTATCATLCM